MTTTEQERHDLYVWLEQEMGAQRAATLMGHLPPVGWADVATKSDLEYLRADLDHLETVLRLELQVLEERFMTHLHQEINRVLLTFIASLVALAGVAVALVQLSG